MIITCEECSTQFKLDDSKVPEGGARVRCSRCKHAFFIHPPGREDDVQAEGLAQEALEQAQQTQPIEPPRPEYRDPRRDPDTPPMPTAGEEAESDWQFNEDPSPGASQPPAAEPETDAERAAAAQAVDQLLGSDLSAEASPDTPLPPPEQIDVASQVDEDPGSDFGDPMSVLGEPAPDTATAAPADLEAAVDAAAAEGGPDLGSPESWDLFGEEQGPEGGTPLARMPLVPRWKLQQDEARREEIDPDGPFGDLGAAVDEEIDGEPSAAARLLGQVVHAAGWCITAALLAFGLWGIAAPSASVEDAPAPTQTLGALRAEEVRGRWIESSPDGLLYVVSGRLVNGGRGASGIGRLGVRLLDEAGRPLERAVQPIGLPIAVEVLREADTAARRAALDRSGAILARVTLTPGLASRFEAVFDQVPPAAVRYRLEPLRPERPPPAQHGPTSAEATPTEPTQAP